MPADRAPRPLAAAGLGAAALGWLVTTVVLGILGMHALTTGGLAGSAAATTAPGAAHDMSMHMSMHMAMPMPMSPPADSTTDPSWAARASLEAPAPTPTAGDMVMACAFMIGAAVFVLVRRRQGSTREDRPRAPTYLARLVRRDVLTHDTGPPPAVTLSVIRC